MPDTGLKVLIHASAGRQGVREFPVTKVEAYAFEASMDVDADSFSIDIGDPDHKLAACTERDTEVRCTIFTPDAQGRLTPHFTGIADTATYTTDDYVLSIIGTDNSSLALGDAPPGRWRHVKPKSFIEGRARQVGLSVNRIHKMAEIGTLYTDGSETEWAFWYRMARERGMYMWTEPLGGLVIDHLGYSLEVSHKIGHPPRGQSAAGWLLPDVVEKRSNKQRQGEVWVFSQDAKTSVAHIARGIDTSIRSWRRKPIKIMSSTTAKTQEQAKTEADNEIFESIVGALEITVTLNDTGVKVRQNTMVRVNLPEIDVIGNYFVVGVRSQAGPDGKVQVVRLREKGFALSKRIPEAPTLAKDPGTGKVTSQITSAIAQIPGIRWADSFVRATQEHGSAAGWDTAVFIAALLSICQIESHFRNVREAGTREWESLADWSSEFGSALGSATRSTWEETFANAQGNAKNPRSPSSESGVGPMQLTSPGYKAWADQYGWNGSARVGEYDGGRWNPDSNIRAAARALVEKGNVSPRVDPTSADNIWIAVARYHGGSAAENADYVAKAKAQYKTTYGGLATAAVAGASDQNAGTERTYRIDGHGNLKLSASTPSEIVKAINFAMNLRGTPYLYGGPKGGKMQYDCSSLVTAAYGSASARLRGILDVPSMNHHGENTYTLFRKGRFPDVAKDSLKPGDLCFFIGNPPDHVGMYIGDGLMVVAPHTGDVVKVQAISDLANAWTGARRLVDWYSPGVTDFGG